MRGSDLINVVLPVELLEEVLLRVVGDNRDRDACALVCRRWRPLERATRRSAKLPASGAGADEVVGLFAERFAALVDVSIDERLSADAGAVAGHASRSRRPGISSSPPGRPRRIYRMPRYSRFVSPHRKEQTSGADGMESTCLTDAGLANLARGCKGLEKLSLVWCSAISSTGLARIAENCKKLTSLDIQACYIGDPGLVAIGEGCKLLNNLNLRFVEGATDQGLIGLVKNCGQSMVSLGVATCGWMTDASLHAVGSHCPNLEILSLEVEHVKNEGVIAVAKGCRLLKTLKLQCIGAGDEALEAIGSYCSLLESLSLNNFERFTDRSLSSIAKGCKNLTDLVLNDCLLLTDRSLEFVARSCKKIARLKINGCQNMETAALEHIGRWCPGLLELSLIYCPRVRDSAFLELGRGCSLLQSLYLVDCSRIGDDAMCHIARGCKNLTEISIRRGYEIGDKALVSVAENCKSLKELTLQFCEKVSDTGLAAIAEGCSLQKLNLCGCQLITDKGLTSIARGFPDIVFLDISVLPEHHPSSKERWIPVSHTLGYLVPSLSTLTQSIYKVHPSIFAYQESNTALASSRPRPCADRARLPMEKGMGGGNDDAARAVGMCDRFLTFLTKNLSMNRQKNITEGPKDGGGDRRSHAQEEEDEFEVKIEKADFKLSQEEEESSRSLPATILEETSEQLKEAVAEASRKVAATEASLAAAAPVQEKKVRKSVTIKEEPAGEKEKAKKSMSKKRQASLSSGAGVEEPAPRPPLRWGLRPRMPPANLRVPSNINEKSSNFIEERRKGFGAGGKPAK